jgi:hypothetical protein
MKKQISLISILLLCVFSQSFSADADSTKNAVSHHLGVGYGLPYGGIGGRYVFSPVEAVSLTAGVGYNFLNVGYNVGVMGNLPLSDYLQLYLFGMFGTNGVIIVEGADNENGSYTGISISSGVKLFSKRNSGAYWDFGLIVPIRSSSFKDDWDYIKNSGMFEIENDPWPVLFTIGYNFKL